MPLSLGPCVRRRQEVAYGVKRGTWSPCYHGHCPPSWARSVSRWHNEVPATRGIAHQENDITGFRTRGRPQGELDQAPVRLDRADIADPAAPPAPGVADRSPRQGDADDSRRRGPARKQRRRRAPVAAESSGYGDTDQRGPRRQDDQEPRIRLWQPIHPGGGPRGDRQGHTRRDHNRPDPTQRPPGRSTTPELHLPGARPGHVRPLRPGQRSRLELTARSLVPRGGECPWVAPDDRGSDTRRGVGRRCAGQAPDQLPVVRHPFIARGVQDPGDRRRRHQVTAQYGQTDDDRHVVDGRDVPR